MTAMSACDTGPEPSAGLPVGIWDAPRVTASGTPAHDYITTLPDGRALWSLPPEGLAGTPPAPSEYWTSRTARLDVDGDRVRFTMVANASAAWDATRRGGDLVFAKSYRSSTGQAYRYLPSPAGPIDGVYRPWGSHDYAGIQFALDGTFADGGVREYLGPYASADGETRDVDDRRTGTAEREARRGGRGRYTIGAYTLELRYDDGRIVRHTILVGPSDSGVVTPSAFLVEGVRFERE